jgi:hypothetical protein
LAASSKRFGLAADCTRSAAAAPTWSAHTVLAEQVMRDRSLSAYFAGWPGPWEFASAEATAERLRRAGFIEIDTGIEAAPTTFASETDYREFVTTVIYRPHLEPLPSPELKQHFIDSVTRLAAEGDPPFTARLLAPEYQRAKTMTHPSIVQPAEYARYSPEKMARRRFFESPRLLLGSMRSSPASTTHSTLMPARTRSITCWKAAAASSSKAVSSR